MHTFEITIQRGNHESWPVVARQQSGPNALTTWAEGIFDLDLQLLNQSLPTDHQYGILLGQNLFRGQLRDAFIRAYSGAKAASEPLRVWLIVESDDLRSRHWEQLCAPFEGERWDYLLLNQATPLSLYLPSQIERRFPPISKRDLRALLLVAGPEDLEDEYQLAPFDVQATVDGLRASLGEIPVDVLANINEGTAGRPSLDALCRLLTTDRYTLLFIVCHGVYQQKIRENLLYIPEGDRRRPVTGSLLVERLGRLEGAHGLPHFTFLSTCESADPQAENGLGGLGQRLVRDLGMPAVLAMTGRISIQTAEELSSAFCSRLAEHGEVDRALVEALSTLQGRPDVTVPALFSRLGGRPLFSAALDRPLTQDKIRYGLEQMGALIEERAPILLDKFRTRSITIQAVLDSDLGALSQDSQLEFDSSLAEVKQLCSQVLELSFNALALGLEPPEYDARPPFRGLYAFRAEDREFFFGRQVLVDQLTDRLNEYPFLAVLGPSGCGKSSLILAGLVPALNAPMAYVRPGNDPLVRLAAAIELVESDGILVIDQFEELFTLCRDEEQRLTFLKQVMSMREKMIVVITMRADFLGECSHFPDLRREMESHQALIGPLNPAELRRVMERQADHVGLRFEAGLGEQILEDVRGEPGAMPLLQHALLLLWQRRHGRWLRWEEYTTIGGIRQAIAHTADDVYTRLNEEEKKRIRNIFTRLTRLPEVEHPQEGTRYTRRRVKLDELVPVGEDRTASILLVTRLADARLLVTDKRANTGSVEVEVAHEALIQHWPRLQAWLDENRADILLHASISRAAREWESLNRDPGALLRGVRLAQTEAWAQGSGSKLSKLEAEYLTASQTAVIAEKQAQERARQHARRTPVFSFLGGAIGFALSFLLEASSAVENQNLLLTLMLLRLIAGGLAGFFLVFLVDLAAADRGRKMWAAWLWGSLAGSGIFGLLLYFDTLLRVSAADTTLPLAVLAGALWGFPAGLGRVWMLKRGRSWWQSVPLIALACGLTLMLISQIYPALEDAPAITVFLSGAIVPFSIFVAAHLAEPGEER